MPLIPPAAANSPASAFERLLTIMDDLRLNCPWDKKQTLESLRHLTIEEVYELSDSILDGDMPEIKKELGDIMLHLVFYARIASETNDFTITDVLNSICDKLINRHPHIYGDTEVNDETDVKRNWEQIKLKEGNRSVLAGVPASLPALVKASRIQEKARGVGFDWEEKTQVWAKVEEEMREFRDEFNAEDENKINREKAESEFGDLLFSLINYA
ncbi:MAG: nucleoside triphosphate pyrophosphohydrolase, partial [Bacteroidetes bacterium]|nr:nucleoside triphosphate pyrophosphohydrolase [Bacteroidota bacterium]